MSMESDAKEAAILKLLQGWSSGSRITDEQVNIYLEVVADVSSGAVIRSCDQFRKGLVDGQNTEFAPSPASLAKNARAWDEAIATVTASQEMRKLERLVSYPIGTLPAPPLEPLGPLEVDLGRGKIDLRGKTLAEKEAIIRGEHPDHKKIEVFKMPRIKRVTDK